MSAAAARPVGVDELRRAWLAVQAGDFSRPDPEPRPVTPSAASDDPWTPASGELVVPVLGAAGSCGATTVALLLATAVDRRARVVECATASQSGLAAASTAELGRAGRGWLRGSRGRVLLDRAGGVRLDPDGVPAPADVDTPVVTMVDVGSQLEQVLAGRGWLTGLLADAPTDVVVARASVPGLRRLEICLHLLGAERAVAVVVGPPRRRWPRPLAHTVGALTGELLHAGRLVVIPEDRSLAVRGLTPDPLPAPLLKAAGDLLPLIEGNPHAR